MFNLWSLFSNFVKIPKLTYMQYIVIAIADICPLHCHYILRLFYRRCSKLKGIIAYFLSFNIYYLCIIIEQKRSIITLFILRLMFAQSFYMLICVIHIFIMLPLLFFIV